MSSSNVATPKYRIVVSDVAIEGFQSPAVKLQCQIEVNGKFILRGVRLVEGRKGLFVGFPSRKVGDGQYENTFEPTDQALKAAIDEAVNRAWAEVIGGAASEGAQAGW